MTIPLKSVATDKDGDVVSEWSFDWYISFREKSKKKKQ